MNRSFTSVLIILIIIILLDLYIFQAVKFITNKKWVHYLYFGLTILTISVFIFSTIYNYSLWPKTLRTYLFATIFIFYLAKIVLLPFVLIDDILRFFNWLFLKLSTNSYTENNTGNKISRSAFILKLGIYLAAIPFIAMLYGMFYGGYHYQVRRVKLKFKNLPKAFNGFKIVQISDIHSGTFTSIEPMKKAVEIIKKQNADLILFTGDLVNTMSQEIVPFIPVFNKLHAPFGVFSILGNHDYSDYGNFNDIEKKQNFNALLNYQEQMGWKILKNQHKVLNIDNENIILAGVENWGSRAHFPKYGDLNKTFNNSPENTFTILMSHDPSHWDAQIVEYKHNVDLTLSGHTHGMQFGVRLPWLKWSPVQWVYKQWEGLHKKNNKYLYVNVGLGFLAYPGRAGIRPEITVIELFSEK